MAAVVRSRNTARQRRGWSRTGAEGIRRTFGANGCVREMVQGEDWESPLSRSCAGCVATVGLGFRGSGVSCLGRSEDCGGLCGQICGRMSLVHLFTFPKRERQLGWALGRNLTSAADEADNTSVVWPPVDWERASTGSYKSFNDSWNSKHCPSS